MDIGYAQGAGRPLSFKEAVCKEDYTHCGYSFKAGKFYPVALGDAGQWITIWDELFRPCICEGKGLEEHFEQGKMCVTKTAQRLDSFWSRVVNLAQDYGFLEKCDAEKGVAVISTHQHMLEEHGLHEYLQKQSDQNERISALRPHRHLSGLTENANDKIAKANQMLKTFGLRLDVYNYIDWVEAGIYEKQYGNTRFFPYEIGVCIVVAPGKRQLRFKLESYGVRAIRCEGLDFNELHTELWAMKSLIDALNNLQIDLCQ